MFQVSSSPAFNRAMTLRVLVRAAVESRRTRRFVYTARHELSTQFSCVSGRGPCLVQLD